MRYVCICDFIDLEDKEHKYLAGEEFPREGAPNFNKKRIKELLEGTNRRGLQLIAELKLNKEEKSSKKK